MHFLDSGINKLWIFEVLKIGGPEIDPRFSLMDAVHFWHKSGWDDFANSSQLGDVTLKSYEGSLLRTVIFSCTCAWLETLHFAAICGEVGAASMWKSVQYDQVSWFLRTVRWYLFCKRKDLVLVCVLGLVWSDQWTMVWRAEHVVVVCAGRHCAQRVSRMEYSKSSWSSRQDTS